MTSTASIFEGYNQPLDLDNVSSEAALETTTGLRATIHYFYTNPDVEFPAITPAFIKNCEKLNVLAAERIGTLYDKNSVQFGFSSKESVIGNLQKSDTHPRILEVIDRGLGTSVRLVDTAFLKEILSPRKENQKPRIEID